ncbi:CPBP family intramembrane glutamic endopeptidase [Fictibacillus norfolkensis]|uniref:CPBP family intramembrane glutamic endopeptidase n=1 Tax=Fictibacillus norfolkensis TaxID=2762233 RepID=UPI00296AE1F1|nr:CPBP family intramembrane glutamic endopeptidase [Fictibacillus norfolkensis]
MKNNWIDQITPRELLLNVYFSQSLFMIAALGLAFFFNVSFPWVLHDLDLSINEWLLAISTGLFLPFLSIQLKKRLPEESLDDGGINEKIFGSLSYIHIFFLTGIIAFAEEWLFRGVLQSLLGLFLTSIIFAVLHVRYIKKPVLFSIVCGLSFWLGMIYEMTDNIWVPFLAHFLIDFISGCWIAKQNKSNNNITDSENGSVGRDEE